MAVAVADSNNGSYDGNLSTVNGFYRAEAYNLSPFFSSATAALTTYNHAVTFANAGNCMGLVIFLTPSASVTTSKSITVALQEYVATVWTTRVSKILTSLEIHCSSVNTDTGTASYITPFRFATPYAVDTTASKWRFQITAGAGTGDWTMRQVSSGNIAYCSWCDTAISFTTNQDQFVAVDDIILDGTITLLGALQTGDTVNSVAGWVCSGADKSLTNSCRLKWDSAPASAYTVTVKGFILLGVASGFQAGTEASPIQNSEMGTLDITDATVGTNTNYASSGFANCLKGFPRGGTIQIYGEIPSVEDTELSAPASSGQANIVTKAETGWVNGDKVVIGRQTTKGNADATIYTVSSVSTTTVTLTTNLAVNRAVDASVFKMNGYGFKLTSSGAAGCRISMGGLTNFILTGVEVYNVQFNLTPLGAPPLDNGGVNELYLTEHCSFYHNLATNGSSFLPPSYTPQLAGHTINHCNFFKSVPFCQALFVGNGHGVFTITNNIIINNDASYSLNYIGPTGQWTMTDNKFENNANSWIRLGGFKSTFRRNKFYGSTANGGSGAGAVYIYGAFIIDDWGENTYDNCTTAVGVANVQSWFVKATADEFGQVTANTYDIWPYYRGLSDIHFDNCKGNIAGYYNTEMLSGFTLRLSKINQVDGNDRFEMAEGIIYKAGDGLSDTTKHTGAYCMKWVPLRTWTGYATSQMEWEQKVPTENIQNKTMSIGIWVNISNAAYYGGNYTMPTLTVNYDNGSIVTGEAAKATGWQYVFVSFTPLTTYGELTVTFKGWSDATAPNGTFYTADMSVLYPAGHTIALGAMGTWAGALPVMPSISTSVSAADVWAADPSGFGASTVGDKVNAIKKDTGLIPATL